MEAMKSMRRRTAGGESAVEVAFPNEKSSAVSNDPMLRSGNVERKVAKGDYGVKSVSPPKMRHAFSSVDLLRSPLQSGINKLVEASTRYNPDRDSPVKQSFLGDGLTAQEVRDLLRKLFRIKLTGPELSAVFAYFVPDGGMELDGNVFIIHFIQMGQAERDRRKMKRLEYERRHLAKLALEEAKRSHHTETPEELNIIGPDVKWGSKDEASAMAMITEAAAEYDKYSPAAVSLQAFEGAAMTPLLFRQQLRRVFNIKLSLPQLAALMAKFDKDQDGTVDCAEFLLKFFMVGFQERSKRLEMRRNGERKRREREEAELEARRVKLAERARMKVDYEYTRKEQESGVAKIVEAAVLYDATGSACLGLGAFQGDIMPPHVFKEQLRKVFNVKLTPPELGAVMHRFDKDGDGAVDVVEFTKAFFKMGFDERTRRNSRRRDADAKREAFRREKEQRKQRKEGHKNALRINRSFSEEDRAAAFAKITDAASKYDKNHPSAVSLDAFDGASMEPYVFREQFRRAFGIKLTPQELGATVDEFDKDGDGLISCTEFLRTFFRLGFKAKTAMETKRRRRDRMAEEKIARLAVEKENKMAWQATLNISEDFSEEERASASAKIAEAASRYDKRNPSCMGLDGFEAQFMPTHIFKEYIKRVFGLKLSPGELGAVVKEFDKDGDGAINCAEFLQTFFRVGSKMRSKALLRRRKEDVARAKHAEEEQSRRILEAKRKRDQAVLAPYTEKDLDDALDMLIYAAARYDRRLLGPGGLKAWEARRMSPTELREALRRAFDVRLSPPQLGAVSHLFGNTEEGSFAEAEDTCHGVFAPPVHIEVQDFLPTFFKISTVAKGLAARSDSAVKLKEYREALKERLVQQEEVKKTLKAMRDNPPKRSLTVDSGLTRQRADESARKELFNLPASVPGGVVSLPAAATRASQRRRQNPGGAAMDPAERVRLHVNVARGTRRLDLSTWANQKKGDFILSRVPRTVWHLTDLKELWLTNNDIQVLPPQIGDLRYLRTLGVGRNRISRLPQELGLLPDLEHIFAEKNWLSTIPKELAMCRRLRELRLSGNQFSRLPDCVCEMRGLEVLDLRGNTIEKLPPELKFLRSLLDLDLEGNPIGPQVPDVLFSLVNLALLNLAGTLLGPIQGEQIDAKLRLDFLCVNADAAPPSPATIASPLQPQKQLPGAAENTSLDKNVKSSYGGRCVSRATHVPYHRLPQVQQQVPDYNTRRLPGLDVLPSDAKAMMKAKAKKRSNADAGVTEGIADP